FAARDTEGRLLGVLAVHRPAAVGFRASREPFEAAAAALAPLLRDFRAIVTTQNAASIDTLTGLANRRSIMELLSITLARVGIGQTCSVLLIDIDRFKDVNDRLGHQAGDRCLQLIGTVIAQNIRNVDRAGRIGGEEFLVMMPQTPSDVALGIGERLRNAVEHSGFAYESGAPVTASLGVATATITDTVESLIGRADKALYRAKREGRNRVVEIPA
ncbi:MAG: GGDEF domain-containing protein, partial [Candidatus Eremiobacteraeota bacterium]|nr:GGDEF domain-containing protein [Candidatus Eremiobacteraeota bacterium]